MVQELKCDLIIDSYTVYPNEIAHIIKRKKRWAIRRERGLRASRILNSQKDAIDFAIRMKSIKQVIVHDPFGRVKKTIEK